MPGRPSTRTSTTSRVSRKPSVPTLNSRASRISSPTVVVPEEGPTNVLRSNICAIFADAQRSTGSHRKLVVNLRKVHTACCYEPTKPGKKDDGFGEDDFNVEMARCVIRLVGVKKSEGVGDRIVKFLGLFLRHASEKDAAMVPQSDIDETMSFPETPSTRLTSHILSILLALLASKEKTVRFRSTQIISYIINSLDSIDDEYYQLLRAGLLKRIRDKEPMVRVQAVLGLGRLAGNEGDEDSANADSDSEDQNGLLEKLVEVLQNDPSADVRRSLLLNLPLTPATLPYLLERARDLDPATRRALYSRLLPALGDFRHLSLSMREKLLRWGLRDRDEQVRKATARLFSERWIEDCAGTKLEANDEAAKGTAPANVEALHELLERIDVVNSGVENGIASEALKEFWGSRPDYREAISFDDSFWDHLSAESVFMVRSFNEFCRAEGGKYESTVEEKMPEVTKLAFFLQRYTNNLIDVLKRIDAVGEGEEEEDTVEQEFIVEQLLYIAQSLDYSDEVGRRKMFSLLREILAIAELPDGVTKLVVDVLRCVCGNDLAGDKEFCGVVLEAIAEVHDTIANDEPVLDEEESFHSARSELSDATITKEKKNKRLLSENGDQDEEKAIKEIVVNMKCLHIAQCMLQNIDQNLQDNVHLVTMLNNLVVPAVRSHEAPIREQGLLCLGLCCLLDKTLAEENLSLFIHCFLKGHDTLQVNAIHTLSDILTVHPSLLYGQNVDESSTKPIFKVFSKGMKATNTPDVQSATTIALCKLMLTKLVEDEDLLKQLVICYFEPSTRENVAVRQALSYFLPVYCQSRRENMERMGKVVPAVVHSLLGLGEELDEEDEMVGMTVIANMLIDWTDARKLVVQDDTRVSWAEAGKKEVKAVNADIHLDLAAELLEKAMTHGCPREEKKVLISMAGKITITPSSSPEKLQTALDLVAEATDLKIAIDAPSRNALTRLHVGLFKIIGDNERNTTPHGDAGVVVPDNDAAPVIGGGEEGAEEAVADADSSEEETKMEMEMDIVPEVEEGDDKAREVKDSVLEDLLNDDEEEEL